MSTLQRLLRVVATGAAVSLSLSLVGVGCGDGGTSSTSGGGGAATTATTGGATCDEAKQGFTMCNGDLITCQPGQYCLNLSCSVGCLSDVNCACNQVCDTTDSTCKNVGSTAASASASASASTGSGVAITNCDGYCDRGHDCTYFTSAETVACKQQCSQLPADQQAMFVDCVNTAKDCADAKSCYTP